MERWQKVLEQNDGVSSTVFGCYLAILYIDNFFIFSEFSPTRGSHQLERYSIWRQSAIRNIMHLLQ